LRPGTHLSAWSGWMATIRQIERCEVLQARCTRAAVFGLWFIGALIGAVIGRIAQPLAAAVPATSAYSQPLNNAGPFYFWRGADMRPMIPPAGAATISRGHEGMVVKEVEPGSPTGQAGLKPGDVVSALDGMPMHCARPRSGDRRSLRQPNREARCLARPPWPRNRADRLRDLAIST